MKSATLFLGALASSFLIGCASPGKAWRTANFETKLECELGIKYLAETDKDVSTPNKIKPSCKRISKSLYVGKYLIGFHGPFNDSLRPTPDYTIKVETPKPEMVEAYFANKTETVDAQAQTERKIP